MKKCGIGMSLPFVVGCLAGSLLSSLYTRPVNAQDAVASRAEVEMLQKEIEQIKAQMGDQSHAMSDVGDHFANLWFAVQSKNWPLAQFFLDETRSHIRWAVRIKPVRDLSSGEHVDLQGILTGIEDSTLKSLYDAVASQDTVAVEIAYNGMRESCIACHQASEKPYLRPRVPLDPAQVILDFAPAAELKPK